MALNDMDDWPQNVAGVTNGGMRQNIEDAGFNDINALHRQPLDFGHKVAQAVRKKGGTHLTVHQRAVSVLVEEKLTELVIWARYQYIVQRPVGYNDATLADVELVSTWFNQLPEDPEENDVPKYSDNLDRKKWFRAIRGYLGVKKGRSGVPLLYAISNTAVPANDAGLGNPSFEEELYARGRHTGFWWGGDNRMVYLFLKS